MNVQANESMSEAWASLQGHLVNNVFPLQRYLGSSDHSGVFLTEAVKQKSFPLALKLVRSVPTRSDSQQSRWLTAVSLAHPHLLRLFEAARTQIGGLPYLYAVMEYSDQNLGELLEHRPLTEDEAREMLGPVLSALAFLHERKFVHAQVKPSNVLVVGDQLKLASDTIRRVADATDGIETVYDPPEARDGSYSTAGDIWALGVTLCEALTRTRPTGLHEGARNIALPATLPPAFREVVARCLSRWPADRPKIGELEAWLRGQQPVILQPAGAVPATAAPKAETAKGESAKAEARKPEPARAEPARAELAKPEVAKPEPAKAEPAQAEPPKADSAKTAPPKPAAVKAARPEVVSKPSKVEPPRVAASKPATVEAPKATAVRTASPNAGAIEVNTLAAAAPKSPPPKAAPSKAIAPDPLITGPAAKSSQPPVMTAVASQGKARPSSLRRVFATLVAVGALALIWAGARMLREQQSAPPPPPAAEVAQDVIEEPATPIPPPIEGPPPVAATAQPAVDGNIAEPAEPDEEAVSASQIHEEIPQIPSRARQTIRGSVKVSVRVIVDPDGTVFAALSDDRGPSRYFERLAIDAAKKWTFTPMNNGAQRLVLLRFEFTRNGTTARAVPLR